MWRNYLINIWLLGNGYFSKLTLLELLLNHVHRLHWIYIFIEKNFSLIYNYNIWVLLTQFSIYFDNLKNLKDLSNCICSFISIKTITKRSKKLFKNFIFLKNVWVGWIIKKNNKNLFGNQDQKANFIIIVFKVWVLNEHFTFKNSEILTFSFSIFYKFIKFNSILIVNLYFIFLFEILDDD
jgi:hypothetical protein